MRAVVQRVRSARVTVGDRVTGEIGPGLLVLLGVAHHDSVPDVEYIAGKIAQVRIFPDEAARMNRSVGEAAGSVLVVSQFTLYGDCRKGRRPSFDQAAPPAVAEALYGDVVRTLRAAGLEVQTGEFQAYMQVALVNDGPVTIILDSSRAL
jgi:D-tyrosyl-tRNA(Tyr) deacylase